MASAITNPIPRNPSQKLSKRKAKHAREKLPLFSAYRSGVFNDISANTGK
jgi:hypothetical protein